MKFITDRFIPAGSAGCARGPFVFIRPQYKDDKGLIAHEYEHVHQWFLASLLGIPAWILLEWAGLHEYSNLAVMSIAIHGLFYKFIPAYRLQCEVECYKLQATYYKDDRKAQFAQFISRDYDLDITPDEALKRLRS